MSFRTLMAILVLTVAGNAAAEDSRGHTLVKKLFNEGVSFDFTSKIGWYSGRCWSSNSEQATAALLVVEERAMEAGPAFPPVQKFILFGTDKNASPSVFDNLSDKARINIRADIDSRWNSVAPAFGEETGYKVSLGAFTVELRQSVDGQYLMSSFAGVAEMSGESCYFFKRVDI